MTALRRFRAVVASTAVSALIPLSAVATTTDATPELRNSPKLTTPERVKTDPFNGTAAYAYKIDVPPGTAGMQPELVLTYSTQTQHSEYGYGWSLNLPYIERSTRDHRPYYNDPSSPSPLDDDFELAGDLLVRDGSTNQFHLRYADGSRILWDAANERWEVTQPDGTRQLFGSTQYSAIYQSLGGNEPAEVFRWSLSEVIDPRGNSYRIYYECDADVAGTGSAVVINYCTYVYPLKITYTHSLQSGGALADHRTIEFDWVERANPGESNTENGVCDGSEDCPTSYRGGFKLQRRKRLARIGVGIDIGSDGLDASEEVRSYVFTYSNKLYGTPPFSQLASIQRFGKNGEPFPTKTEFTYTRPQRGFKDDTGNNGGEWSDTPGMIASGQRLISSEWWHNKNIADMNGDGVMDRIVVSGNPGEFDDPHEWLVYLGRIVPGPDGVPQPAGFDLANPIHWTFDCGTPGSPSVGPMCEAARSEHIQHEVGWSHLASDLVDVDGDFLPDRVVVAFQAWHVYRNHGTGFGPREVWPAPVGTAGSAFTYIVQRLILNAGGPSAYVWRFPADVNGDGRPEYFFNSNFLVNTGAGFGVQKHASLDVQSQVQGDPTSYFNVPLGGPYPGQFNQLIDVNGDGLVDHIPGRVCSDGSEWVRFGLGYAEGDAQWQRSTSPSVNVGHAFVESTPCQGYIATSSHSYPEARLADVMFASMLDMNGDGIRDWVYSYYDDWVVYFGLGDGRFSVGEGWYVPEGIHCTDWGRLAIGFEGAGESIGRTIDLDGDGLVDYVLTVHEPGANIGCQSPLPGNWSVWRNPGPEGLLETVTNELGGVTTIQYTPSTWLKQLQEEPEVGVPSDIVPDGRPRWVVTHVRVSDGRTGTAEESESLDYAGFRFDQVRREGFGVRMAENTDAEGLVTRSLFHQHPKKRGKLQRQEKCQGSACLETAETEWTVIEEPVPGASFLVRPTKTTTTIRTCDPENPSSCSLSAGAQLHVVDREFDDETGLLVKETDYGADASLAASGDNLVRVLSYARNTAEWIVSTVFEDSLYFGTEGSSNLVSRTRLYYDAAAAGAGTPSTPQRCTTHPGSCGALVTFRETLRERSPSELWATEKWTYDGFGNLEKYFEPKLSGGSVATQTVAYDDAFHTFPVSIKNALDHESQFHFDAGLGEVEKAMTPGGYVRCFGYDGFGRLASRSEGSIAFLSESFETVACDTPLASFQFLDLGDSESQRIVETLETGSSAGTIESLRYFDGLGREYQNETRHRHNPPSFDVVSRAWGTRGELTCETLPFRRTGDLQDSSVTACSGQTPRRETNYDDLLRPVMVERVEPGGGRVTEVTSDYLVNGFGLASSVGDLFVERRTTIGGDGAAGQDPTPDRVQLFGADNKGQVVVLRDGSDPAATTTLTRDPKGRITRVDGPDVALISGGDQNLLEIAYNAVDQRKEVSQPISPGEPNAPRWLFAYDLNGDLSQQTSPRNQSIRFHYDTLRRLALKDYGPPFSSSASSPGGGDIVYVYHTSGQEIGQLASVYGRHGIRTDFDYYDYRGRVWNKTRDYWGSMQFGFGYSYDLLDRPLTMVLPDQSVISYVYDGAQLTTMGSDIVSGGSTVSDVLISEVDAHPSGGLSNLWTTAPAFGDRSTASSYTYRPGDHRLASAVTLRDIYGLYGDTDEIQSLAYSYDTAGNLRQSDDLLGELDQEFSYDSLHRLAEVETLGTHGYGTHRYTYDAAGNIRSKGPAGAPGELNLRYDRTPGQPTHIAAVDQLGASGWVSNVGLYTADADGGITSRTQLGFFTTSFARNPDGRVQGVGLPVPDESLINHYDPTGERSEKLHLGVYAQVLADRYYVDPSYEVDTFNNTHEVHFFVGGRRVATSKRTGLGNGMSPTSVTQVTTYHPDQVGTNTVTTTITAAAQAVSKTFLDPFGATQSGTGTEPRHLFTDQERDAETGLDYFGARFYDPWIGRFLEEDPELIGSSAGVTFDRIAEDAGNLNAHAYALNQPTRFIDPTGAMTEDAAVDAEVQAEIDATQAAEAEIERTWDLSDGGSSADSSTASASSPGSGPGSAGPTGLEAQGVQVAFCAPCFLAVPYVVESMIAVGTLGYALDQAFPNLVMQQSGEDEAGEKYPANPDDWVVPEGWTETEAGEKTGGRHRQWKDQEGRIRRRWDSGGREDGKERGPHWHDYDDPSSGNDHIEPGS